MSNWIVHVKNSVAAKKSVGLEKKSVEIQPKQLSSVGSTTVSSQRFP